LLAFSRVGGANWSGLFTQSIHCSRGVKGAEVEEWTRASFLWKSLGGHNIKTYIQYIHPRNIYKLYKFFSGNLSLIFLLMDIFVISLTLTRTRKDY
jgi:hypothetical protein